MITPRYWSTLKKIIPLILLVVIVLISTFQSYRLITMFKFVDEYNNWVPAGLMHQGKALYTDIFFNRMPMPAYISHLLLSLISPQADYYRIIQIHRLFMMAFSASWIALLYWQFRKKWVLLFAASFELLKPYFFGFSFQAEAMLVYPFVYLYIMSISQKIVTRPVAVFSGICVWFIFFTRETMVVTVFLISVALCVRMRDSKSTLYFLGTFFLLSLVTIILLPQREWVYQMITVNRIAFQNEIAVASRQSGLWGTLTLPFQYIFLSVDTQATHFQRVLAGYCVIGFMVMCISVIAFKSKWRRSAVVILYIFALLFTSSLRVHAPEKEFWAIYRLIPWIGLILVSICYFTDHLFTRARHLCYASVIVLILFYYAYPNSFLIKPIERQREYDISYFDDISYARAIEETTKKDENVFVIGYASHIYTLSHRKTSYPDSFYYPIHYAIPLYENKVLKMLASDPPVEVFITDCNVASTQESIKTILDTSYVQLLKDKKPSCLYVRKDLVASVKAKLTTRGFN